MGIAMNSHTSNDNDNTSDDKTSDEWSLVKAYKGEGTSLVTLIVPPDCNI